MRGTSVAFSNVRSWTTRAAVAAGLACALASSARAGQPTLSPGTYRLDMRLATRTEVPVLGTARAAWESVSLVTLRARGGRLVQQHRPCNARVESGFPGVSTRLSPGFVAALAAPSYPVELRDGTYRADFGIEYVGYRPHGRRAPLPRLATDPSIIDWDRDGQPGATLELSVPLLIDGAVQIVQRGHSILEGRVVSPERAEGRIKIAVFEQAVIGARPEMLKKGAVVEADPERSWFVLTRVPDGTACASLDLDDGVELVRAAATD